jgi:D-alanyl-D-alanine carboxypeptidase
MFVDAQKAGHTLMVTSAFRRPEVQTSLYTYWTSISGDDAKRGIAEAGHSEHQLGTTVDLTAKSIKYAGVSEKLGKTKEGVWLKENSYKYGFIMSYPEGKESITGYRYEPWHFRYVGIDTAKDIHDEGITIKEYFDIFIGNDF